MQRTIAYCGAAVLVALTIVNCYQAGAPYFAPPVTVLDHVWGGKHPQRNTVLVVAQLAGFVPRGAKVTCFKPQGGRSWNDDLNFLTAVGLLPHDEVEPPLSANADQPADRLVDWIITVDEPLDDPRFIEVAHVEHGWVYRKR